jgi:nucleotide-binding universal stress UspA family protein
MYRHILIPTDGSELAEHAVTNGLSLAKSLGAKVTVIIVEDPALRHLGNTGHLWNSANTTRRSRFTLRVR